MHMQYARNCWYLHVESKDIVTYCFKFEFFSVFVYITTERDSLSLHFAQTLLF